jgi:signal transduction histidine kinase
VRLGFAESPPEHSMSKSKSAPGPALLLSMLSASPILPVVVAALAMVIFVIDSATDQGIAIAVFYVIVVFLGVLCSGARGVLLVSGGCMALTLLSYMLWPRGPAEAGAIDTVISLIAIGATGYFALKIRDAEAAKQEARSQLAHVGRLNSLGELAASIAHEINQPLAAIASNADAGSLWLARESPDLEEAGRAFERIARDAVRASDVIERIRRLARKEPLKWRLLDINESILEIVSITQSEVQRNRISLRTDLTSGLPPIFGDRVQIQQVILNLVVNAIEALRAGEGGQRNLLVSSAPDSAGRVRIDVRDSGKGFDPAELDHVFDPFTGSKPGGMGFGLTISRSIVEAHGGRLSAASAQPRGAIFTVSLPVGKKRAAPEQGQRRSRLFPALTSSHD